MLRPERRPLAPVNVPQVMSLLSIALGCPEEKEPKPLLDTVERVAAETTALFAPVPAAFCNSVRVQAQVRPAHVVSCFQSAM